MREGRSMPFGVEPEGDGLGFRLWAPAASRVALELESPRGDRVFAMEPSDSGWFELNTAGIGAAEGEGALYRYRIDGREPVPDPASRFQPRGVGGPSQVILPGSYRWAHPDWRGRPWHEAVIYELHVGTFSPEGTFDGVRAHLDHLVKLGVTAVELMPVAAFPGRRGWGYDGVLPFAPHHVYGDPHALRHLVDEAHGRELMVFLDVVYNHFGPEGNHLPAYAPEFFTDRFETPWGDAIDFGRREVREFFIQNALYWLDEYRIDGLRLDAVHAIRDDGDLHILEELADRVHARFDGEREVHLVLENGKNESRFLSRDGGRPCHYVAQWNDDAHHAFHVAATGERDGYYEPYADDPAWHLARCLAEGFAFQGEPFEAWDGRSRGEPSAHLPPGAFVHFLQNHDQVGNRALGERMSELAPREVEETLLAILLLAPSPPLLFMGEEWAAPEPFLFFCDFHDELAERVREGRRSEFARFPAFRGEEARRRIPDPNAPATFRRSVLDWDHRFEEPHVRRLSLCRRLLELRHREIVPRLRGAPGGSADRIRFGDRGLAVRWILGDGSRLRLVANVGSDPASGVPEGAEMGALLYARPEDFERVGDGVRTLPPWSAAWYLEAGSGPAAGQS